MSKFSGKFDVYDLLMSMHRRCKNGSDAKEDLEKASALYSDEYECFNEFKKATNGTLYQHKKIKVTKNNQDMVAKMCKAFEIIELPLESNQRKPRYIYKYYGNEYKNLKELNKKGVYITLEIHFDSMLDLIPYYPYIIKVECNDENGKVVYLSNKPYTLDIRDEMLERGIDRTLMYESYTKELQDHYKFVVNTWYTPKPENHIFEKIKFNKDNRRGVIMFKIDDRFDVKWFFRDGNDKHIVWSQPKVIDYEKGILEISEIDAKAFDTGECFVDMYVTYYSYRKPTLYLS